MMLGKKGLGVGAILKDVDPKEFKVSTVTDESKSWSGNGLDVAKKIKFAMEEDLRFGTMLLLGLAFGLRKKEQLMIKPWKADRVTFLEIDGNIAKGGRKREIKMDGEYGKFQRWCLDEAKRICKKYDSMGWEGWTFDQSVTRYYNIARKLGFTKSEIGVCMHGLRAEFAENMAIARGLMPPSLGGDRNQMCKEDREKITIEVSEQLGHNDIHTIGAYYGSFRLLPKNDSKGAKLRSVIIDSEQDLIGTIFTNPGVVKIENGKFRQKSQVEIAETAVTIEIEKDGEVIELLDVKDFVLKYSNMETIVKDALAFAGLGNIHLLDLIVNC